MKVSRYTRAETPKKEKKGKERKKKSKQGTAIEGT